MLSRNLVYAMVRFIILVSICYTLIVPCLGQSINKLEKRAQKVFYQEDFERAIEEYNALIRADSRHKLAKYRLTICSLLVYPRSASIEDILIYKKTQGRKDKFFYYWLGRIYFVQNNFKKAIESWKRFLKSDKYKSTEITSETKDYIQWAELANAQYNNPDNYEIEQLSETVNSPYTEFSPVYFKQNDELLFLSSRNSLTEEFEIFHTYRQAGQWLEPEVLRQFGRFLQSNANIEVVEDGARLYLYKGTGHRLGELFSSTKDENGNWTEAVEADPGLSHSKLESHFFINQRGNRVLFAHRRMQKPFDLDIYQSFKDPGNGKWSKPELFSQSINSEFDEDYPFLSKDEKTIYFSSMRHGSIGGYDIFKSEYDEKKNKWGEPKSLKYPANSTYDDIQFKIDQETNSGYFVSDRVGSYGSFDIFFFHESTKILVSGVVMEGKGKPADHAQIHFKPKRKTNLPIKAMTDSIGRYSVKLGNDDKVKVEIYFHDDLIHSEILETPPLTGELMKITKNFNLTTEKVIPEVIIDDHVDPEYAEVDEIGSKFREINKAKLNNIYFDPGSYHLKHTNHERLEGLLRTLLDFPNLTVVIAGHTDNVGNSTSNMNLSLSRAQAVVRYLTFKGVNSDRLIAKGYGDTRPLASNDDEKEGRELNRRIEVVVIE